MKNLLIAFCFTVFLLPCLSWACIAPRSGAEYDALIEVEKINKNKFKATVKKKAGKLNSGANIAVGYYSKADKNKVAEYWKGVYEKEEGEFFVAVFDLKNIEGYIPFLEVYWRPETAGMCGAYGRSKDLQIE